MLKEKSVVGAPTTLLAAVALVVVGCGDSVTGDSDAVPGIATLDAVVRDEPSSSSGSSDGSDYSGTAAGDFRAEAWTESDGWVRLGSLNGISVQLQSADGGSTVHGAVSATAGTYARARLVLEDVEVTVESGGVVGDSTLAGDATVQVASGQEVVIERSIGPITVDADGNMVMRWNLDSEAWLTESAIDAGTVSAAELQEHVEVTAGSGG